MVVKYVITLVALVNCFSSLYCMDAEVRVENAIKDAQVTVSVLTDDGITVKVDKQLANEFRALKNMISDCPDNAEAPVHINSRDLKVLLDFARRAILQRRAPESLSENDREVLKSPSHLISQDCNSIDTMVSLLRAAEYLDVTFRDLIIRSVAVLFVQERGFALEEDFKTYIPYMPLGAALIVAVVSGLCLRDTCPSDTKFFAMLALVLLFTSYVNKKFEPLKRERMRRAFEEGSYSSPIFGQLKLESARLADFYRNAPLNVHSKIDVIVEIVKAFPTLRQYMRMAAGIPAVTLGDYIVRFTKPISTAHVSVDAQDTDPAVLEQRLRQIIGEANLNLIRNRFNELEASSSTESHS